MVRFAFAALAVTLTACSYTHHYGVDANGDSSQLYFYGQTNSASAPLAVGYGATIDVRRYSAGDVDCTGLGTHKNSATAGGLQIRGGSLPDTDRCDNRKADAVTVVSAACADDTCAVTGSTIAANSVSLTVVGAHAGTGRLLVTLKSAVDGTIYEDSVALHFEAPARIRLQADARSMPAVKAPSLPGVELTPLNAWVVDANDERLEIDPAALKSSIEGDAYESVVDGYEKLVAKRPGHTSLRWSYPGVPERSIDLEVVDPSEARALFVYAPDARSSTWNADDDGDPADAEVGAEPSSGRITSIDLVEYGYATYPYRVKLADGRFALASIGEPSMVLTPAALGMASWTLERSAFDLEGKLAGHGTLTLTAAPGATLTLPVNVTARPPR